MGKNMSQFKNMMQTKPFDKQNNINNSSTQNKKAPANNLSLASYKNKHHKR